MTDKACFTLRIHTRTGHFGETSMAERLGVASLLRSAASEIASGAPATPIKDGGGHIVAEYEFGPAMINGPGEGFDDTHRNIPPVGMGGALPERR
ncbi:hypothetical protein MTR72_16450 [Bradyrhizobium sp. ISRA442]|uniref:hypothetical protein n=1 Tax=Bradyrhizobium sp. ISRA442 TaxID=2866197 RepID=UPI00311AD623